MVASVAASHWAWTNTLEGAHTVSSSFVWPSLSGSGTDNLIRNLFVGWFLFHRICVRFVMIPLLCCKVVHPFTMASAAVRPLTGLNFPPPALPGTLYRYSGRVGVGAGLFVRSLPAAAGTGSG